MSRVACKVEGEDWYIVYCNTIDRVFPLMFEDEETAELFIKHSDAGKLNEMYKHGQGIITIKDIEQELKENVRQI